MKKLEDQMPEPNLPCVFYDENGKSAKGYYEDIDDSIWFDNPDDMFDVGDPVSWRYLWEEDDAPSRPKA